MTKDETTFHQAEGFIQYSNIFFENRDLAKNTDNDRVKKARQKTNGLYKMRFYPKDQDTLDRMKGELSDPMFQGYPRWKTGEDYGVGEFVMLTRKHEDPSGVEVFGGAPEVVHWSGDRRGDTWDFMGEDGPVWDGSRVVVKYTTYGEGESQNVRLVKVGIIELEEAPEGYDPDNRGSGGF